MYIFMHIYIYPSNPKCNINPNMKQAGVVRDVAAATASSATRFRILSVHKPKSPTSWFRDPKARPLGSKS